MLRNTLDKYVFMDKRDDTSYNVKRRTDDRRSVCKLYSGDVAVSAVIDALRYTDDINGTTNLVEVILETDDRQHVPTLYTCIILEALSDGLPIGQVVDSPSSFQWFASVLASIVWQLEIRGVRDMRLTTESIETDKDGHVMLYGTTEASFDGQDSTLCEKYYEIVKQLATDIDETADIVAFVDACRRVNSMSDIVFKPYLTIFPL